jgi:hypothetical protein
MCGDTFLKAKVQQMEDGSYLKERILKDLMAYLTTGTIV